MFYVHYNSRIQHLEFVMYDDVYSILQDNKQSFWDHALLGTASNQKIIKFHDCIHNEFLLYTEQINKTK